MAIRVEFEYIHQVVNDLRLNELHHILEAVNQNKSGSIQLLRERVLTLLFDPTLKFNFKQKILEVYNARLQQNQQTQQPPRQFLQQPQSNLQIHCQSYTPPRPNLIQSSVETSSPDIQFEHLPFFKTIQTLLNPVLCNTDIDSFNLSGIFQLTEDIRHAIVNSWNSSRQEYKIQIILRFLQVGPNENITKPNNIIGNVTERLPYNIVVSVNDDECKLPTLNIPKISGMRQWRCNDPIDITHQTVLSSCVENTLKISCSKEHHTYMAGVYVAHRLTWNNLLEELKKRPVRASDKTKELIKISMESDPKMAVQSLIVTVKDPLTKLRMKLPARGVDCIHLQCFDAIPFLQMNEQKAKWICPICMKKIKFENIEVDEFYLKMLQSPKLSEECERVLLLKDGTWSDAKNREFSNDSRKTKNCGSTNNIKVFTLSDPDDDNDEIMPKPKRPLISIPLNRTESSTMSNNVNHPNISISGSNNCVAGSSGSSRNNRHQEKKNSRSESDKPINRGTSCPSIHNNVNLPYTSTSGSNNCVDGSSGSSRNNRHQENNNSRSESDKPINGGTSCSLIHNNVNLPYISTSGSNNCVAGSSGSSRNNRHQENNNSRTVLCVITLD